MLSLEGRQIPDTLAEIVDPAHTVVLMHDIQNDNTGPDGIFGNGDDVLNIGSAISGAGGVFTVQVGVDGANSGLVNTAFRFPNTAYNVGADGYLGPHPVTGINDDPLTSYSLVRVRAVDTSGNSSNPGDPNALRRFVVDTTGPRIRATRPTLALTFGWA